MRTKRIKREVEWCEGRARLAREGRCSIHGFVMRENELGISCAGIVEDPRLIALINVLYPDLSDYTVSSAVRGACVPSW